MENNLGNYFFVYLREANTLDRHSHNQVSCLELDLCAYYLQLCAKTDTLCVEFLPLCAKIPMLCAIFTFSSQSHSNIKKKTSTLPLFSEKKTTPKEVAD
jgi:hypothetical protein